MIEQLYPAIISALFIVTFVTALVYASDIPEKEEEYRNSKEYKDAIKKSQGYSSFHDDG